MLSESTSHIRPDQPPDLTQALHPQDSSESASSMASLHSGSSSSGRSGLQLTAPSLPRFRGWHRRFHPATGTQMAEILEAQLSRWQQQLDRGQAAAVVEQLDFHVLPALAGRISAEHCLALAQEAYHASRYDLGSSLLQEGLANSGAKIEQWQEMCLLNALCLDKLGLIHQAKEALQKVVDLTSLSSDDHQLQRRSFAAALALLWIDLRLGALEPAADRLRQLRKNAITEHQEQLDQIRRLITNIRDIINRDTESIPHQEDLSRRFNVALAIDNANLSRCGRALEIDGWLVDPRQQISQIYIIRNRAIVAIDLNEIGTFERNDLEDVIKRCGGHPGYKAGFRLSLVYQPEECKPLQSGESVILLLVLRDQKMIVARQKVKPFTVNTKHIKSLVNTAIDDALVLTSPELLRRTRQLWKETLQANLEQPAQHYHYGAAYEDPELSVIIPLYGRVDFMDYQLNWFGAWRRKQGDAEIPLQLIYVLDDPRLVEDILALSRRCQMLYGFPFELVINSENTGYAAANNRGAQYATAPLLLLLNSDVLPEKDDSLLLMLRAMQQQRGRIGALGALLLFDNKAIQHRSMEFIRNESLDGVLAKVWLNDHPSKGMHFDGDPTERLQLQETEAASAACLMLPKKLFDTLGGFSLDYIIGDFEDSDLCLKIRDFGLPIAVDLMASFFHLERQSVSLSTKSSSIKMKLVAANASTHHQRWCSTIERLKSSTVK